MKKWGRGGGTELGGLSITGDPFGIRAVALTGLKTVLTSVFLHRVAVTSAPLRSAVLEPRLKIQS